MKLTLGYNKLLFSFCLSVSGCVIDVFIYQDRPFHHTSQIGFRQTQRHHRDQNISYNTLIEFETPVIRYLGIFSILPEDIGKHLTNKKRR